MFCLIYLIILNYSKFRLETCPYTWYVISRPLIHFGHLQTSLAGNYFAALIEPGYGLLGLFWAALSKWRRVGSLLVHRLPCLAFLAVGSRRVVHYVVLQAEDTWSCLSDALRAKAQTQMAKVSLLRLSCRSNSGLLPASGFSQYFARRYARFIHLFQFDAFGLFHKELLLQILLLSMYYNLCRRMQLPYWSTRAPSCNHSRRPRSGLSLMLLSISYYLFLFPGCIAFWMHFGNGFLQLAKNSLLLDHVSLVFFHW